TRVVNKGFVFFPWWQLARFRTRLWYTAVSDQRPAFPELTPSRFARSLAARRAAYPAPLHPFVRATLCTCRAINMLRAHWASTLSIHRNQRLPPGSLPSYADKMLCTCTGRHL